MTMTPGNIFDLACDIIKSEQERFLKMAEPEDANRKEGVNQALFQVLSNLDYLVEHAKLGDLSWSDLQEIKDNIKILEAKCNGNR